MMYLQNPEPSRSNVRNRFLWTESDGGSTGTCTVVFATPILTPGGTGSTTVFVGLQYCVVKH